MRKDAVKFRAPCRLLRQILWRCNSPGFRFSRIPVFRSRNVISRLAEDGVDSTADRNNKFH